MQLYEVIERLNVLAPFDSAQSWDNVGLMFGDPMQDVRSVLVALDPITDVILYAREHSIDLILTHHPLIFRPIRNINLSGPLGKKVSLLAGSHIALVSMHTNLDEAEGGVADILADRLGLLDVEKHGLMRIGKVVKHQSLETWVRTLPFEYARIVDASNEVARICVCPGSGMDLWGDALGAGCDTIVTGDVRYHSALDAWEAGLNVVDLGHFETEALVLAPFVERLGEILRGVRINAFEREPLIRYVCIRKGE